MKTLIAIPCMDLVHTRFMRSILMLNTNGHEIMYELRSGSLIYDSRNQLLEVAKKLKVDRIFWVDSDMDLPMDALQMLEADIEAGCDMVSGLYFKRKPPFTPVVFRECGPQRIAPDKILPVAACYEDYPKNSLFEVEAFGFGCVLMTMAAAERVTGELGAMPFMPAAGFGEDLSFCMRARKAGIKLWCDSRVKCGHIGYQIFTGEQNG